MLDIHFKVRENSLDERIFSKPFIKVLVGCISPELSSLPITGKLHGALSTP